MKAATRNLLIVAAGIAALIAWRRTNARVSGATPLGTQKGAYVQSDAPYSVAQPSAVVIGADGRALGQASVTRIGADCSCGDDPADRF